MDKLRHLRLKIKRVNIKLNALPVYIKNKKTTNSEKVFTNFRGLNVLEDDMKYESFTVISIDSLLVYDSYY